MGSGNRDADDVKRTILAVFEAGRCKDFGLLAKLHVADYSFSKFSDSRPSRRLNASEAIMHEELEYAGVSDFSYSVNDLKIDVLGEIAVTTFTLDEKGILVNTYTFEATPLSKTSRVTMVLKKDQGEWKVLHEHFSQKIE